MYSLKSINKLISNFNVYYFFIPTNIIKFRWKIPWTTSMRSWNGTSTIKRTFRLESNSSQFVRTHLFRIRIDKENWKKNYWNGNWNCSFDWPWSILYCRYCYNSIFDIVIIELGTNISFDGAVSGVFISSNNAIVYWK